MKVKGAINEGLENEKKLIEELSVNAKEVRSLKLKTLGW
jgi:hypothetical protein